MTDFTDDTIQNGALTVFATMRARAGQQSQLKEVLTSLIVPTRSDPGLISYELYQDTTDEGQFCFLEVWESVDALEHHMNQPHLEAFTSREADLVDGGIRVHRLRLLDRC